MIPCIIVVTLAIVLFHFLEYTPLPFFTRLVILLPSHILAVSCNFCFVKKRIHGYNLASSKKKE